MTMTAKEKPYAQQTLEAIPEILKNTSMTRILDQGFEAGLSDYSSFTELVADEEFQEKMKQIESLEQKVKKLTIGLHDAVREDIDKCLEELEKIAMMNHYEGAEKMADILDRFYLRHHLGLDVQLGVGRGKPPGRIALLERNQALK